MQSLSVNRLASLTAALLLVCGVAHADPVMERVTVTAKFVDGSNVICEGSACAQLLEGMIRDVLLNFGEEAPLVDEVVIGHPQFCRELRQSRPAGCSLDFPPSTPQLDSNWTSNGCGTEKIQASYLVEVLERFTSQNLNEPLPNVSFYAACRSHDRCYAMNMGKGVCDDGFAEALNNTCNSSASATYHSACTAIAGAYQRAVRYGALGAYNQAAREKSCAEWAHNMKQNKCS